MTSGRAAWLLVLACSFLHLVVAGRVELSGDEAHYALYAYFLDWSYFDHPPLVGWLQALVLHVSDSEFALRLWPVLLGAIASGLVYRLTRELFPHDSAWVATLAVVLLQSALAFQVLSLAMLPDTPLLPLSLAAALFLRRALETERLTDWLVLGLLIGLAGLAKYTAVLLVASSVLLVVSLSRWSVLRRVSPWLAVALALVVILPVLGWNWQHDWLSFRYQLGHGMPDREWQWRRLLLSQAGQLVAYGPALYLFGLFAIVAALRRWREHALRWPVLLALPPLLLFGWSSGYEPTLPHWTLVGWALIAPLAARWLYLHWSRRMVRVVAWTGLGYSLLLTLILHTELFAPWLPFPVQQYPFADLYGWQMTASRAEMLRQRLAQTPGPVPVIFAGNWSFASHIAWYVRPVAVQIADDRYSQSDLWYGTPAVGARGILVVPYQFRNDSGNGLRRFSHCALHDELTIMLRGVPATSYALYECSDYRG